MPEQYANLKARENTFKENQSQYSILYTSNWDFMFSVK